MADEALDGPGMGAVDLARAEIARRVGDSAAARGAIEHAIGVFYGLATFVHQLAWLRVQQAFLSLELDDPASAETQVRDARARFEEARIPLGIDYCSVIEERIQAANAALA
jgi:hypothetical protein